MSEHILKVIADLEAEITQQERALDETRSMVNMLCKRAGLPPRFELAGDKSAAASTAMAASLRGDEFFNKPLATCVRDALNRLKAQGKAPAAVETIYEVLLTGGFEFPQKSRDAAVQGLAISIGKNSGIFARLPSGLIGVREWYGTAIRQRRTTKDGEPVTNGDDSEGGDIASPLGADTDEPQAQQPGRDPAEGLV